MNAIEERTGLFRRRVNRQTRFANPALTDERYQSALGFHQERINLLKFHFAPDKCRRLWRQIGFGRIGRADAFVQRKRFRRWFNVDFFGEDAAASFVLRERCAALSVARIQQHQLPVRFFAPGIEREQARGVINAARVFMARQVIRDERMKDLQCLLAKSLALGQEPLFKLWRVADEKSFEQITAVQLNCGLEIGD